MEICCLIVRPRLEKENVYSMSSTEIVATSIDYKMLNICVKIWMIFREINVIGLMGFNWLQSTREK